jgi:hypothetical protein
MSTVVDTFAAHSIPSMNDKFLNIIYQVVQFRDQNRSSIALDEQSETLLCMLLNDSPWWVEDRHFIYVCMEKIIFDKTLYEKDCEFFMTMFEEMAENASMNEDADAHETAY